MTTIYRALSSSAVQRLHNRRGLATRYARERLRPRQTLPAVALVTATARIAARPELAEAAGWRGAAAAAADAAIAAALVLTFRIWDDLADRDVDSVAHPDRLTARRDAMRTLTVWASAIGIATAATVWWRHGWFAVGVLAALAVVLASWYLRRGGRSAAGDHLRLLKYPVFAVAISGPHSLASVRGALAIVTAYLAVSVHEWWHDPRSPVGPRMRVAEATLLVSATLTLALCLSWGESLQ